MKKHDKVRIKTYPDRVYNEDHPGSGRQSRKLAGQPGVVIKVFDAFAMVYLPNRGYTWKFFVDEVEPWEESNG